MQTFAEITEGSFEIFKVKGLLSSSEKDTFM